MGRVIYPLRFSTSFLLSVADRLTQASISLTGTVMSLVSSESGAVSFGVFDLSSLLLLSLLGFGAGDLEGPEFPILKGESVGRIVRPLRVRTPLLAWSDLAGVMGCESVVPCGRCGLPTVILEVVSANCHRIACPCLLHFQDLRCLHDNLGTLRSSQHCALQ